MTVNPELEFASLRRELMSILNFRYLLFTAMVSIYGLTFVLAQANRDIVILEIFPIVLLSVTFPIIVMNYFLTKHFYRIDTYINILEKRNPDKFRWQTTYPEFRRMEGASGSRLFKSIRQSAYTFPLLIGYAFMILLGAVASIFLLSGISGILEVFTLRGFKISFVLYVGITLIFLAYEYVELEVKIFGHKTRRQRYQEWWERAFMVAELKEEIKREWYDNNATLLDADTLVFLDRDGVLNENKRNGVLRPGQFHPYPGLESVIQLLIRPNFRIAVVTNQPYFEKEERLVPQDVKKLNLTVLENIHKKLDSIVLKATKEIIPNVGRGSVGAETLKNELFKIYYCLDDEDKNDGCRKPNLEMFEQAIKEFGIKDPDSCRYCVIGDKDTDLRAADKLKQRYPKADVSAILVTSKLGEGKKTLKILREFGSNLQYLAFDDLTDAILSIR